MYRATGDPDCKTKAGALLDKYLAESLEAEKVRTADYALDMVGDLRPASITILFKATASPDAYARRHSSAMLDRYRKPPNP